MKTLLALLLLIPSLSYSKNPPQKFLNDQYIFKYHEFIDWPENTKLFGKIETHGRISQNSWNLRYETEIVRDGKYSLRFEMRDGDCGSDDCPRKNKSGRSEVSFSGEIPSNQAKGHAGEVWYAWSIYLPEDTNSIYPAYTILGQFKMYNEYLEINKNRFGARSSDDENCPEIPILFYFNKAGITFVNDGVTECDSHFSKTILSSKNIHNKWHDILMHVNWTDKETGFTKIWVNGQLVIDKEGKTINKIVKNNKGKIHGPSFRFGIYNGGRYEPVNTQIAYYDAFKASNNCEDVSQFYDCEMIKESKLEDPKEQLLKELDFDIN